MAQKKLTAYWLLLLVFLLTGTLVLCVGQAQARYAEDMLLFNTVAEPAADSVTSDCLAARQTVLLGRYDPEGSMVAFSLYSAAEVSGNLIWTVDQAAYMGVQLSVDGTPLNQNDELTLLPGQTKVAMTLIPTDLAAALEQDMDVRITVTWNDTLTGTFLVTLGAASVDPAALDEAGSAAQANGEVSAGEPEEGEPAPENETEEPAAEPETVVEAKATISGRKILTGRAMKNGEFTFRLYQTGSDYQIVDGAVKTAVNGEDGAFSFEELVFTDAGDYYYVVTEDPSANLGGVAYDGSTYKVHIVVTESEQQLETQVSIVDAEEILFTNTYTPAQTTFTLRGTKRLTGDILEEGMFTFLLYQANEEFEAQGEPLQSVTNDADGLFSFAPLTYTQATQEGVPHYYVVMEDRTAEQEQVEYDKRQYRIAVTVIDDGCGQLTSVGILSLGDGETVDEVVFSNIYTPGQDEEPVIRIGTIGSFDPKALLPVQIAWIEGVEKIQLGMNTDEGDQTGLQSFPAYTCYSLDQGLNWYMLYYGGLIDIAAESAEKLQADVLFDFSHTQLPRLPETDATEDTGEDPAGLADLVLTARAYANAWPVSDASVTAKPDLDPYYQMGSCVLTKNTPLAISLPESWNTLSLEYNVEMLTVPELSDTELAAGIIPAAKYEAVALNENSLIAESSLDQDGYTLTLRTGDTLPAAGTYRLNLNWIYEGIRFEQTQITFFINYSVDQTQTAQEVPNDE